MGPPRESRNGGNYVAGKCGDIGWFKERLLRLLHCRALDGAEPFMPPGAGAGASFHAELCQDVLDMFFDGASAQPEDRGDLGIAFAFDNPAQDFSFAQA